MRDWFTVLPKHNVSHRVKWHCISIMFCYCRSPSRLLLPQTTLNIMWLGEQINAKLCNQKETTDRCWSQKVKRNALRCLQRQGRHCELYAVCGEHHRALGYFCSCWDHLHSTNVFTPCMLLVKGAFKKTKNKKTQGWCVYFSLCVSLKVRLWTNKLFFVLNIHSAAENQV